MKRIFSLLMTLAMLTASLTVPFPAETVTASSPEKEIDVYFIAGQSNAAGCSHNETITDLKPAYTEGHSNVLYLGCAMSNQSETGLIVDALTSAKLGMGINTSHFGAEVGMAEFLSQYYNANSGKYAVIVKYAVPSASLDGSQSAAWGSWLAPSLESQGYAVFDGGVNFYYRLLNTVESSISTLNAAGYTKLNYKGFYWSQGESEAMDMNRAKTYSKLLGALVDDFRNDLYDITGNEQDLKLPFLISEICPTINGNEMLSNGSSTSPAINKVVEQQRLVASTKENVKTLNTTVYTIKNGEFGCRDVWHYGGDAMIDIGNRVGQTLYGRGVTATVTDGNKTPKGCSATVLGNADGSVTVSWDVPQNYTIQSISLNGNEITDQVQGNSFTVSKALADETAQFTVQLYKVSSRLNVAVLQSKLKLVFENADGSATVYDPQAPRTMIYEDGTVVRFKLFVERKGYFPACVKCNGIELQKDADGFYSVTIDGDSALEIRHTRVQTLSVDLDIMLFNPKNPLGK